MALDTRIPLMGAQIDTANPLQRLSEGLYQQKQDTVKQEDKLYDRTRQEKLDNQQAGRVGLENQLTQQQLANAKFESLDAREKSRMTSTVYAATELKGLLDGGNIEGAQSFLDNRKAQLQKRIAAGENVDTQETDHALKLLREDPEKLKAGLSPYIQFGQMTGILKNPEGGKNPATITIANEIKKARDAGDTQRVNDLMMSGKMLEKGQGVDSEGSVIVLPGADNSTQNMSHAKETGSQQAKVENAQELKRQQQFGGGVQYKAEVSYNNAVDTLDRLKSSAQELVEAPGLPGITGISGSVPNIPGSDASNAQAKLNVLKSQVSLGVLQAMREASKTGGALGNVSDAEGKRLEDNLAALDKAQSYGEFKVQLKKITEYVDQAKGRIGQAYHSQYGGDRAPIDHSGGNTEIFDGVKSNNPPNLPKVIKYDAQGNRLQ